jgi:hypothetical protein
MSWRNGRRDRRAFDYLKCYLSVAMQLVAYRGFALWGDWV